MQSLQKLVNGTRTTEKDDSKSLWNNKQRGDCFAVLYVY